MMGLSNWLHWMAWFVKYFIFLLVSVSIMTVFYSVPISSHGSVIGATDPTVLLVFLLVYTVATISFCFMISVFFNKGIWDHLIPKSLHDSVVIHGCVCYWCWKVRYHIVIFHPSIPANSAAAAGGILFVIAYIPYFFLQPRYDSLSWSTKMATSVISNVAMSFGAQIIGMFEGTGENDCTFCIVTPALGWDVSNVY